MGVAFYVIAVLALMNLIPRKGTETYDTCPIAVREFIIDEPYSS